MKSPCRRRFNALALAGGVVLALPRGAAAQAATNAPLRRFPTATKVGRLALAVFPVARLDGAEVRLAPGARILATDNRLVIPSTLSGEHVVRYRTDPLGQIIEVWLLTAEEAALALRERDSAR